MTTTQLVLYAALIFIILVYLRRFFLTRSIKRYSAVQLADRMREGGVVLLDVRTAPELRSGTLKGAVHIPAHELKRRADELKKYTDREVVCYCKTGRRSLLAAARLTQQGFRASHLEGGIIEWNFSQRQKG